jgi:lactate dehydrogenase-like 2-hydroxyacid dehydrogenase
MDVLMPVPLPPLIRQAMAQHFTLHTLWNQADPDALIEQIAPRIKAIVTGVAILAEDHQYPITSSVMQRFPNLRLIANLGVGYDNIDVSFARQHGIEVTNTPDVLTDETADTAMGLLLNTIREFSKAEAYLRAGHWLQKPYRLSASLRGRTMGIVGLGRIGKAIAKRAEPFGLRIVYHGRHHQTDMPYEYYPSLVDMARAVDILMIVAPGGPQTRHMINAQILQALGADGVLINIARGSLVDEEALIEALTKRTIRAAGLDVYANEPHVPQQLLDLDHVVLLPHIGSGSQPTRDLMCQLVVDNVLAFGKGEAVLTPVRDA